MKSLVEMQAGAAEPRESTSDNRSTAPTASGVAAPTVSTPTLALGRLVGFADGSPLVLLTAASSPIAASAVGRLSVDDLGRLVAVMFIDSNPALPLVIGVIADEHPAPASRNETPARLEFEATREIVMKCGKATLRLLADGTAVLRGVNVVTRAAATNRIRGGNVQIN